MKRFYPLFACFFLFATFLGEKPASALMFSDTLESPNKEFRVEIWSGPILSQTSLAVFYMDEKILEVLDIGFLLENGEPIPSFALSRDYLKKKIDKGEKFESRSTAIRGETREVREENAVFNEHAVVHQGFMKIIVRAYDDGVDFCFEFCPEKAEVFKIKEELTLLTFADDFASADAFDGKGKKTEAIAMALWEKIALSLWFRPSVGPAFLLSEKEENTAFPISELVAIEGKARGIGPLSKHDNPEAKPKAFRFQKTKDFESFVASAEKRVRSPWRSLRIHSK